MQFVPQSYKENDAWGISRVTDFLKSHGFTVKEKVKEDYGIDIEAYTPEGKKIMFEVEVSPKKWTSLADYPYPRVSFLGRKAKWAKTGYWYIIISKPTEHFLICHSDKIFRYPWKEEQYIDSPGRQGMDTFYRIPKEKCKFYKLIT